MRLHHLSVTAFGPFVDTAEVDFDLLTDAGLFLLSGATGAGKTSVLDAVCFALYGAVPGDRQHAGRLRSDRARAGLAPSVTLEVTLSGRRFRIVRSPAWERPKKRGTGTTREQARVALSERVADAWVPVTSRLDEAGDLLSGLLGMNLDQFCQMTLLPQGQFQAFLRADSGQRHKLLARLFRTGRFERVETWLRDHRIALRRDSDGHASVVADLVSRLSEASHRPPPGDVGDLGAAADAALADWAREVGEEAGARRTTTATAAREAAAEASSAAETAAAAHDLAAARARVVTAAEVVERLDLLAADHAGDVQRLEQARRAEGTRPIARIVAERDRVCRLAEERATGSVASLVAQGIEPDDLTAELDRVTDELAGLTALLPAERRLSELREQEAARSERLRVLSEADELATADTASLQVLNRELEAELESVTEALAALPAAESEAARLEAVAHAHDDAGRLVGELELAQREHAAARALVVDLRERLLDLRERRIAGMAAELAGGLVVGGDCPVCGSADHPHPARSDAPQPDARAEREAQRVVDDAQAVELARRLRVREVEAARDAARAVAGRSDPAAARQAWATAQATLTRLRAGAAAGDQVRASLAASGRRSAELTDAASARHTEITRLTTALDHLRTQSLELEAQVAAGRGRHPELASAVAAAIGRRDLLRGAGDATSALEAARDAYAEAVVALDRAALEAGFADAAEARDAQLDADTTAALDARVQQHRAALTSARQVLDEPDSWDLLTGPDPEVVAADARAAAAAETLERTRAAEQIASTVHARVSRLAAELDAALDDWAPVRRRLALATRVSAFAEGKAADNRLQMRLSAYVLAYRLSQIVAAANGRLRDMSGQRYSLEHVARRGAGESRGGLSLVVRDDWSGESRDPATLSGGETFVVSLALALGLADVVAHEAGGADLQTLFVDEGFGALDAETLDDVLDILDTLRENGRAVGVVSHVAEMRDRIPTQLAVGKSRSGSTLRVVG
jgi:DNA repair protein SbcC/Rad50